MHRRRRVPRCIRRTPTPRPAGPRWCNSLRVARSLALSRSGSEKDCTSGIVAVIAIGAKSYTARWDLATFAPLKPIAIASLRMASSIRDVLVLKRSSPQAREGEAAEMVRFMMIDASRRSSAGVQPCLLCAREAELCLRTNAEMDVTITNNFFFLA